MLYPHLLAPGSIGGMTLKNHIVQGPAELEASGFNGEMSDDYIDYYEDCARHGAGLIITAYASVDDEFSQSFAGAQLKVTDRRHTAALSKLARRVHKYDARIFVQIYMAGRSAVPTAITGKRIVAPSPIGFTWHDQIPEEITRDEILAAEKKFARAASILQDSGIDGVEIVAAGGYLINQFLSKKSNFRTDEYGGSFENRTRFIKEVVEEIRKACGPDYIISIRFSADEFLDGGYTLEDGVELAKFFESIGVNCLNINNANQEKRYYIIEPIGMDTGWKSYIIKAIKDAVSIPVLSTNVIKTPQQAEDFLAEGLMDFPVMTRAFLADPEWARKAKEDRCGEIRPCIGCLYCVEQTGKYRRAACALNPTLLRLDEFPDRGEDLAGKRIIVAGAGPAGMEAAIQLKKRGANVTVFEKRSFVGGAVAFGSKIPHKEPLKLLTSYYETMIKKLDIDVRLNTAATKELICAEKPYAVFVATGGNDKLLPGLTLDGSRVLSMTDVLQSERAFPGEKVVVVGGGLTACEVSEFCAANGAQVTQLVRRGHLAKNVEPDCFVPVLQHLRDYGAEILFSHSPVSFDDGALTVLDKEKNETVVLQADRVILCIGSSSERSLFNELKPLLENVILIGDASCIGRVAQAVQRGFEQAYVLE